MSEPGVSTPLEYASQTRNVRPMSLRAARWVFLLAFVPPIGGLAILGGYWLDGSDVWAEAGGFWLLVGGGMTFVLGVIALVNGLRAILRKPGESEVGHLYLAAFLVALAAVAVGWFCLWIGGDLTQRPHFRLVVNNATATRLDRVVVHFTSGDVTLGPIGPGQKASSGLLWPHHDRGPLYITTVVDGRSRRIIDQQPIDDGSLRYAHNGGPRQIFAVIVEPRELPALRTATRP